MNLFIFFAGFVCGYILFMWMYEKEDGLLNKIYKRVDWCAKRMDYYSNNKDDI